MEVPLELPLESLSWRIDEEFESGASAAAAAHFSLIVGITTLTNLELQEYYDGYHDSDLSALQSLPLLQRLALKKCDTLAKQLVEPGTLTSLQELHVEDDSYAYDRNRAHPQHLSRDLCGLCMSRVLRLPRIRRISGNATLLARGLPQSPEGWHMLSVKGASRVLPSFESSYTCEHCCFFISLKLTLQAAM